MVPVAGCLFEFLDATDLATVEDATLSLYCVDLETLRETLLYLVTYIFILGFCSFKDYSVDRFFVVDALAKARLGLPSRFKVEI